MRYGTIPAWTYMMLIVMGIGFTGGAIAFLLFVPPPAGQIVGAIWIVMGLSFVFFSMRALAKRRDDDRIRTQGIRATATLLSGNYTGITINNMPQFALHLRIDGNGPSYQTTLKLLTFNPPADGTTMSVRVDPQRREHVVLAADSAVGAPDGTRTTTLTSSAGEKPDAADTVRLLAELDRMHADGTLGDDQFETLKRRLLESTS